MTTPTSPTKTIPVVRENPPAIGVCRADSCRRSIEWVTTLYGRRRMPVDSPLRVVDSVDRDGQKIVWIAMDQSHFATCPDAIAFRQRKQPRLDQLRRSPRRRR